MSPVHLNLALILQFWRNLNSGVGISWDAIDPNFIPLLIFCLRTANLSLSTLRLLAVVRGQRISAWILALLQSALYIISITGVLSDLYNPLTILAYAGGFATGNVVGMWMESRLAPGHALLRITSSNFGPAIREALHEQAYGATELPGAGKDGTVSVLHCYAPRKAMAALQSTILAVDPQAFLTVVHVRQLRGGWRS
jgi:uncharacterized protein YebE (UPF0316 family)